jgi:hypothetical protein
MLTHEHKDKSTVISDALYPGNSACPGSLNLWLAKRCIVIMDMPGCKSMGRRPPYFNLSEIMSSVQRRRNHAKKASA